MMTQNFILEQENDVLRYTIRQQKIEIKQLRDEIERLKKEALKE